MGFQRFNSKALLITLTELNAIAYYHPYVGIYDRFKAELERVAEDEADLVDARAQAAQSAPERRRAEAELLRGEGRPRKPTSGLRHAVATLQRGEGGVFGLSTH